LLLSPLGFWLGRTWVEQALLVGSAALVLIVELLNSAIESTVDRVSMEHHELSKRAKDLGSAAVMLSLLLCTAIWACAAWVRFSS
jgi:diacylglycerol kinase (ATP)